MYKELLEFTVTERQRLIIETLIEHKTVKVTAARLKISHQGIYRLLKKLRGRQQKMGKGEHFIGDTKVQEPLTVKGTSTLYKGDEAVLQWVKTDLKKEDELQAFRDVVEEIAESVVDKHTPTVAPTTANEDILAVYTIGDAHIGLLAHKEESGEEYNLDIASSELRKAMTQLVESAPNAEQALIVDVGDYFHSDNQNNETSHNRNKLDVSDRWFKVLRIGLMAMVDLINTALTKHGKVTVRNAIGNHNEHSAIYLSVFLNAWFRTEPRVEIIQSPAMYWYYQFHSVLLGITHGHTAKAGDLPEIMAHDCESIWSDTRYRVWLTGHIHHDSMKEYRTCKVESFRTLAAKDAWHSGQGYRSGRDMKCIVFHKDFGEIHRITVNSVVIKSGLV